MPISIVVLCLLKRSLKEAMFLDKTTVSARIEPQSWLDPHPTKILIEPQSKRDIEIIEPHLELTPTQGTNTYAILLEMGKTWQFSEEIMMFYLSKNWTSWNYFHIKNIGVVFPSWTVCICFFMLNPLGNVVGQRVHVNMTRFVTCYNGEFTFTLEYM